MITVVGEIVVDLIEHTSGEPVAYPGGSPANVAVALARLGRSVSLVTQLGDDPHGRLLLRHLEDNGVSVADGSILDCPRTSTAHTSLSADGQADYTFDIAWRTITATVGPETSCVHTGSLATVLSPGADDVLAVVRSARPTSMISFDPNCRPSLIEDSQVARDRVALFVAYSDIVKVSFEDLAWLYPGRRYEDIGREWLDRGARLVVVTRGGDGVWACTRHRQMSMPALPVEVVDTVGAGDSFTAGLLWALGEAGLLGVERRAALEAIDDMTLTSVVTWASRVAAVTCGRRGANPPTLADLRGIFS